MAASPDEMLDATVLDQARWIARGEVSSEEIVRLYLARIAQINPGLQAFTSVFRLGAPFVARRKDAARRRGEALPPFHGVPIGIKDLYFVRGHRTRFGSRGVLPLPALFDDSSVATLRRAGFVILGKLATAELGALPVTEPDLHPPTRNPWNLAHSSGGSSGGSAAAVAARLLPVAHGSDGGGSIRIPASFCGLVGLKPARGRLRDAFGRPDAQVLYTTGALTRTVGEAAALLDVMAGITTGTPHWAPPPPEPFAALVDRPPGRLRVRVSYASPLAETDPQVREAVAKTAALLAALGHDVEERRAPDDVAVDTFLPLWSRLVADFPLAIWRFTQPITRWLREEGATLRHRDVAAHHRALEAKLLAWLEGCDLWLTPTVPVLPPRVGQFPQTGDPEPTFRALAPIASLTAMCNLTGSPGISIPAGTSREGLPIGVHLAGPRFGEAMILQVSRQLEQAAPWPLHAPEIL